MRCYFMVWYVDLVEDERYVVVAIRQAVCLTSVVEIGWRDSGLWVEVKK